MATFQKLPLSASTDGRAIKIAATATPGTTIHTGPSSASEIHEVWLYATNSDTDGRDLTIEWGGVSSPDDLIKIGVEEQAGLILVVPGLLIVGNATPLTISAFAGVTNVITVTGYVNRIA